jgi:hypothetical protein
MDIAHQSCLTKLLLDLLHISIDPSFILLSNSYYAVICLSILLWRDLHFVSIFWLSDKATVIIHVLVFG